MAKKDSIAMLEAKIDVLTRARKFVEGYCGVCYSLSTAYTSARHDAYFQLRDYVSKSLNRHGWLEEWVKANRPHINRNKASMRCYRLQWIDWMISCLEEDLAYKQAKKKAK